MNLQTQTLTPTPSFVERILRPDENNIPCETSAGIYVETSLLNPSTTMPIDLEEREPENGGFDPAEENDEQDVLEFDNSEENEDESLTIHPAEKRYFERCQEIESAVAFAKDLLGTKDFETKTPDLVYDCLNYMAEEYKKKFKGVRYFRKIEQLMTEYRSERERKLLDFIKNRIWTDLKNNDLISKPWVTADYPNETYHEIFAYLYSDLYKFAAEIIGEMASSPAYHHLFK